MRPVTELPRAKVRAVFTDLDDTLTEGGRIAAPTYDALWRLHDRGFAVVIVSGRPAGWADCLMRLWPLAAVVFENGAGMFVRRDDGPEEILVAEDPDPATSRKNLESLFARLRTRIPHLKTAADQPYRRFDIAIDFAEDPPFLKPEEVDLVLAELAKEKSVTAKLSSIHVNYWAGTHTKVTACRRWLETEGKKLGVQKDQIVFSGDSPNDEPLFEFFPLSVGVANLLPFLDRLRHRPAFVTSRRAGAGFVELANFLLAD